MKAIRLALYTLAGLIASTTFTRLAAEVQVFEAILYALVLGWLWTLTYFGRLFYMNLLHLDEAEMGTLRATLIVIFVTGILINWSFEGYPAWISEIF